MAWHGETVMRWIAGLVLALGSLAAGPALSADPVTEAMQGAYVPYRAALFRTNSQAQLESEQAVAQAQQAWMTLSERYGSRPPAPYDRDPKFADTLAAVAAVYERAAQQIRGQGLPQAHATLEQVRDLMADLRRRNDVVVYSDHMNAYHAEMEKLLEHGAQTLASPQGPLRLMEQVGSLAYLAHRLRSEAPAALLREAEFTPLLEAVEASVSALRAAALSQDVAAARAAIGKLKGPYSRLFLKFG
jgi:hypothetical protein